MRTFAIIVSLVLLAGAAWADLSEGFDESVFPPASWRSFEDGDGVNVWARTTGSTHSGLGKAESNYETLSSGLVAQRWLISPKLRVNNVGDALSFWVRTFPTTINNDSLYIRVSTTDSLPSSFTTDLAAYKCGGGGDFQAIYVQFVLNLAAYVSNDIFIAFVHRDEGAAGNRIYLDDVTGPQLLAPPYKATTPSPADWAYGVAASTDLSWVNGGETSTIDLYFAQTYDSVFNSVAAAKKIDNVLAASYDSPSDLVAGQRYFWKVVARNAYGATEGPIWRFWIVGPVLSGSYDLGGGANDFEDFETAVAALYGNGISDAVTFNVYGGDYNEQVNLLGPIPGASADDTVKFFDASGTARLRVTSLLPSDQGVIHDSVASYVIWDGIDIELAHVGDSTYKCLVIKGASNCVFRNATWRGAGYTATIKYAVYMSGSACNYNLFDNLVCTRHNTAFYITGSTSNRHTGNVIRNCAIENVWSAFYLSYTPGIRIYNNDIQINGAGASGVQGVNVYTQSSGDTVYIYRNKFHNFISGGSPAVIRSGGGAGSILNVYNNFFYDIQSTGTSTFNGVLYAFTAGATNFDFNSIRIPDFSGNGAFRCIYMSSSTSILNIRNNIFYCAEPTAQMDVYYASSAYLPTTLDYNAYYNDGGGNFRVYRVSTTSYTTVAELRAATVFEDHGVEGNPGFTSATDLHIQDTYNLVSNVGLPVAGIGDDFDGQPRSVLNPDVGADEYTCLLAPPADYAVTDMLNVTYANPEFTLRHPQARVVNRGSAAQTDAPVVFFYNDFPQDTVLVSLAVDEVDTVEFDWTTPEFSELGTLEVQSFLAGDADLTNDSVQFAVRIVGPPMHDTYEIGWGFVHYANFSSAVEDLTLRGMDGAVIFDVCGTHADSLVIGPITGASASNTITFRQYTDEWGSVAITRSAGQAVVRLVGADYVTIDGIDITATGACLRGVEITGDADYNTVRNAIITGSGVSLTTTYGIHVRSGGNDHNTFENLTLSGSGYGINLYAAPGTEDIGNEVRNCTVLEARYGLRTQYQRSARVHDCDVQPGWTGATAEVYGLYASSQTAGDTVFYYNNKIHNVRTIGSAAANGIYSSSTAYRIYNNFVYDFQSSGTGPVYGIRVSGGSPEIYFNSVYIGEVATTGGTNRINGFYQETASSLATLKNNIFQIEDTTHACYAINRYQGALVSDYNCVYSSGPGAAYNMGCDGTTNYATLALWQAALAQDLNSVEGNPGLVSITDLHIDPLYYLVDSAGTPIAAITDDIDGDVRDATFPDMGADEYDEYTSPNAVTDLTIAYDSQSGEITLRWSQAAGADAYRVYWSATDTIDYWVTATLLTQSGVLSFTYQPDSGPRKGFYFVTAYNTISELESAPSNLVGYVSLTAAGGTGTVANPFGLPFRFWVHPSGQPPTYGMETYQPSSIMGDQCNCGSPTTADLIVRQDNGMLAWRDSASNCAWKGTLENNSGMIPGKAYWYANRTGASRQFVLCGETDHHGNYGSVLVVAPLVGFSAGGWIPYSWRESRVIPRDQLQLLENGFTGGNSLTYSDLLVSQIAGYYLYWNTATNQWAGVLAAITPGRAYWFLNRHVGHDWTYTYTASGAAISLPPQPDPPPVQAGSTTESNDHETTR